MEKLIGGMVAAFEKGDGDLPGFLNQNHQELFKIPPDIEKALQFSQKRKIYRKKSSIKEPDVPLPMSCSPSELSHAGDSIPLFFEYCRFCVQLLALMFIASGIYSFITNMIKNDSYCDSTGVECSFVIRQSWLNKSINQSLVDTQIWINLVAAILLMIAIQYHRKAQRKTYASIRTQNIVPSAYSLRIRGIEGDASEEEIKKFICKICPEIPITDLKLVVRSHVIGKVIQKYRDLNKVRGKQIKVQQLVSLENIPSDKTLKKLDQYEKKEGKIVDHINKVAVGSIRPADVVFISFKEVAQAHAVYKKARMSFIHKKIGWLFGNSRFIVNKNLFWKGKELIKVDFAPEPTDILWENLGIKSTESAFRWIFANFIVLFTMAASFAILVSLKIAQSYASEKYPDRQNILYGIAFIKSIVVTIVNSVLTAVVRLMEAFEKKATYTNFYFGVARKLSISMFFNTTFTSFLANIVGAWTQNELTFDNTDIFFGNQGVLVDIFFVFLTQMVIPPLLSVFSPEWFIQKFNIWRVKRGYLKNLTQAELNVLFQPPNFDLPLNYGSLLRMVWFTAFYAPVLPICALMGLVGTILFYYGKKYQFLRRCSVPYYRTGYKLHKIMTDFLDATHFFFSLGNLIWGYIVGRGNQGSTNATVGSILICGLSFVYLFLPKETLNKRLFKVDHGLTEFPPYDEAKKHFYTNYDLENPATRQVAMTRFVQKVVEENEKMKQHIEVMVSNQHHAMGSEFGEIMEGAQLSRSSSKSLGFNAETLKNLELYSVTHTSLNEFRNSKVLNMALQKTQFNVKKLVKQETNTLLSTLGFAASQGMVQDLLLENEPVNPADEKPGLGNPLNLILKSAPKESIQVFKEKLAENILEKVALLGGVDSSKKVKPGHSPSGKFVSVNLASFKAKKQNSTDSPGHTPESKQNTPAPLGNFFSAHLAQFKMKKQTQADDEVDMDGVQTATYLQEKSETEFGTETLELKDSESVATKWDRIMHVMIHPNRLTE